MAKTYQHYQDQYKGSRQNHDSRGGPKHQRCEERGEKGHNYCQQGPVGFPVAEIHRIARPFGLFGDYDPRVLSTPVNDSPAPIFRVGPESLEFFFGDHEIVPPCMLLESSFYCE